MTAPPTSPSKESKNPVDAESGSLLSNNLQMSFSSTRDKNRLGAGTNGGSCGAIPAGVPPPPPDSLDDAEIIPFVGASFISRSTYHWITPMMRTLQVTDLWKVGPEQEAGYLAEELDAAWARRQSTVAQAVGVEYQGAWQPHPSRALENQWRDAEGRREASLAWAFNDVSGHVFWIGGAFKDVGDTGQLMGPILVKKRAEANLTVAEREIFKDAICFYTTRSDVQTINLGELEALGHPCARIQAQPDGGAGGHKVSADKVGGLENHTFVSKGAKTRYLWPDKGLVNAIVGTVEDVVWIPGSSRSDLCTPRRARLVPDVHRPDNVADRTTP
ncbi:hypothetical protein DFH09DRAFT_1344606 [Mycena vulgaris]|nr:hypothetical protein DFH09DRAFT_1344606 [Mycena vulgaris]